MPTYTDEQLEFFTKQGLKLDFDIDWFIQLYSEHDPLPGDK